MKRIGRRQKVVVVGTPLVIIDAVEDAEQVVAAGAQQAIELIAILRRLNLLGVRRADRPDAIRKDPPGFPGAAPSMKTQPPFGTVYPVGQTDTAPTRRVAV